MKDDKDPHDNRRVTADNILPASIGEAGSRMRNGSLNSEQLTKAYFHYIDQFQPKLNMFISQQRSLAIGTAVERDAELAVGKDRGPLHGIPILLKDMYEMLGTRTTSGSKVFSDRMSKENAYSVGRMLEAGAVVLGKTNMNELAAGISGTNAYFGDCHNPWALDRSPGGSSSGNAAALAAGIGFGGASSDTGGSIRVPASWCGIVGLRPTPGLVSLSGLSSRTRSIDCAGPHARNVIDVALMLDAMAGFDLNDEHSSKTQRAKSYAHGIGDGIKGVKFGVIKNYTYRDVDPPIANAVKQASETLAHLGAEIVEVRIEPLEGKFDFGKLSTSIMLYEFNQILGDTYRATPNAETVFGPLVTNDIVEGSKISRDVYESAIGERPQITAQVKKAFSAVDALLMPALPMTAPLLTASRQDFARGRQFMMPFSYVELPSLVVPCGFDPAGLPIGLQIITDHFQDAALLQIGYAFEQATDYHKKHPPIFADRLPV